MIACEYKLLLLPLGGWRQHPLPLRGSAPSQGGLGGSWIAVSTTFEPCAVSIEPSSTTEVVSLVCRGVVSFRVSFTRDPSSSTSSAPGKTEQGNKVVDVDVGPPPGYMDENGLRTVSFRTPFPCSKIDAVVAKRDQDFPCVFRVQTFCQSSVRSSSMSTPQAKGQR